MPERKINWSLYGICSRCRRVYHSCAVRRKCPVDGNPVCRYCCQKCPHSYTAKLYDDFTGERCSLLDKQK